ncbi:MAG: SDR family NAD(P)-dependent oxidoreductase [Bacteroidia bacterium]
MKKIVFVTGATAGFGKAIAEIFSKNNYDIIINGRRKNRLDELEKELRKNGADVLQLPFDVRDKNAVKQAVESLTGKWQNINILVNNAGLAQGLNLIQEGEIEDWDTMIDTNVKGLLYVSRAVMPLLIKTGNAHVFNIGSIAGKEVYQKGNVYCATKHAVDAITKAMRIDMLEHGIKVTGICPGAAETEFSLVRYKGDAEKAKNVYNGFTPLYAQDIAEIVYFAASRPAHVCINDIIITPTAQANAMYIHKTI